MAKPCGGEAVWGTLTDSLNPAATREFIRMTYERYRETDGDMFGTAITAVFTDEPKYFGQMPYTGGMFEAFEQEFGYDLKPRLWHLFSNTMNETSALTRLHYRQWLGQRFREAWLKPVSDWCHQHGLALVGHISPEDDPVEQNALLTNLLPCFHHFDLPGIDLIIPAVGDANHPLLNIGVVCAASAAQQQNKPGVMSESLGCSGHNVDVATHATRILRWQLMMGVTSHVIHGAFNSVEGHRLNDAPPDWGPDSVHWPELTILGKELAGIQPLIEDARQIAPVAILWPIRSFAAKPFEGQSSNDPMRDQLVDLVHQCLEHQVGIHMIDEDDLIQATLQDGQVCLGRARYSHILIPSCIVLAEQTIAALLTVRDAGVTVLRTDKGPRWRQTPVALTPAKLDTCPSLSVPTLIAGLPRLVKIAPESGAIRCTVWVKESRKTVLLMNLAAEDHPVTVDGNALCLPAGRLHVIQDG